MGWIKRNLQQKRIQIWTVVQAANLWLAAFLFLNCFVDDIVRVVHIDPLDQYDFA